MTKVQGQMTSGCIWKQITFFAMPLLLGNLFQQLYNTVDSLIVGNFLGSNSLAAVSSSGSLIFMLVGFISGLGSGAGVVVAQCFGARDYDRLGLAVHTTVAGGLIASVALTLFGVLLSPQILMWMGTPEVVMEEAVDYLQLYFAGSFGLVMYNIFVGILQAVGDSKHPLYYLIASSVINLVLDVVFIAVLHFGVGGAAIATAISQFVSAILCLCLLLKTDAPYRIHIRKVKIDKNIMGQILRLGVPSGVQNSIIAFANVVVQSYVNAFGPMAMAGYGAYAKIEGFAFLPINSFTMALTTFVGQNIGAREYERTKKGAKFGIISAMVLSQIIGVVIFIFAPQMVAAFDQNPDVILFGVQKARTAALFFFILSYSHAIAAIMRGAGKASVPMFIMMICWCFIRVAILAVAVPLTHSILAVYWVYPFTWTLSSAAFFIYYKKANWLGE